MDLDEQLKELLKQAFRSYRQMLNARREFDLDREFALKAQITQHITQVFNLFWESDQSWRAPDQACIADFEAVYSDCSTWLAKQYRKYPREGSVAGWIREYCQSAYELIQVKKAIRQLVEASFTQFQEQGDIWKPESCDDWYYGQICLRVQNRLRKILLERYEAHSDDWQVSQSYIGQQVNNLLQQFFDELDQTLCILIHTETNSTNRRERSQLRNQILGLMQSSGKIWKCPSTDKPEFRQNYNDAWQETQEKFFGGLDGYDPGRSGVMYYFNATLENTYRGLTRRRSKYEIIFGSSLDNENESDYYQDFESIFGQSNEDEEDSYWEEMLGDVRCWADEDRSKLLSTDFIQTPPTTCQRLILTVIDKFIFLVRDPNFGTEDNSSNRVWSLLAEYFGISSDALKRTWNHKCLPHIRCFLKDEGWL